MVVPVWSFYLLFFYGKIRNFDLIITSKIFTMIDISYHTYLSLIDVFDPYQALSHMSLIFICLFFYFVTAFRCSLSTADNWIAAKLSLRFIILSAMQPHLIGWIVRKEPARGSRIFRLSSTVIRCRRCMIIYEILVRGWFACLVGGGFARGYRANISGTWAQHPQSASQSVIRSFSVPGKIVPARPVGSFHFSWACSSPGRSCCRASKLRDRTDVPLRNPIYRANVRRIGT